MRSYGTVKASFWTGHIGRSLRAAGAETQLVALYLQTGPMATAIGLYYLPIEMLRKDVALPPEVLTRALRHLATIGFARYDAQAEVVWVIDMAREEFGEAMATTDKQLKAVRRMYAEVADNVFLGPFFDRYARALHLPARRVTLYDEAPSEAPSQAPSGVVETPTTTISGSPLEGAYKPLGSVPVPDPDQDLVGKGECERETPAPLPPPPPTPPASAPLPFPTVTIVQRRRLYAAFEGPRVWVPQVLHAELVALRHHVHAEAELFTWYEQVSEAWTRGARAGDEPGADMFRFWRGRYDERWPPTTTRASETTLDAIATHNRDVLARRQES